MARGVFLIGICLTTSVSEKVTFRDISCEVFQHLVAMLDLIFNDNQKVFLATAVLYLSIILYNHI